MSTETEIVKLACGLAELHRNTIKREAADRGITLRDLRTKIIADALLEYRTLANKGERFDYRQQLKGLPRYSYDIHSSVMRELKKCALVDGVSVRVFVFNAFVRFADKNWKRVDGWRPE